MTRAPDWGYDGWRNDTVSALAVHADHVAAVAAATHFAGADTIGADLGLFPAGLAAYGSYVNNFRGWAALAAMIAAGKLGPDPFGLSITVQTVRDPARCGDFEPGGLRDDEVDQFIAVSGPHFPGLELVGYTNAANLHIFNGKPLIRWSAHFGVGMHVCGPATCGFEQAHFTQWDDHGPHGENYDRWIIPAATLDRLRGHPTPPTQENIVAITAAELQGVPHVFVEAKDGSVWYTFQPHGNLPGVQTHWNGAKAGHIAGLVPFAPAPK